MKNSYGQVVAFAIENSYMSLKTESLKHLDIRSYLAPILRIHLSKLTNV